MENKKKGKEKRKQLWAAIKISLGLVWKINKKYTITLIICAILLGFLPLIDAYFVKLITDFLVEAIQGERESFTPLIYMIGLFFLFKYLTSFIFSLQNTTQRVFGDLFSLRIEEFIVDKSQKLDFEYFENSEFYDKLERAKKDSNWRPLNMFYHIFSGIQNTLKILSVIAVIFTFQPLFLIILLVCLIPRQIVEFIMGSQHYDLIFKETTNNRKRWYLKHILTSDENMKEIKIFRAYKYLLKKYQIISKEIFEINKKFIFKRNSYSFLGNLVADISFFFYYLLIAWKAFLKEISIGDFNFYAIVYFQATEASKNIVTDISQIYENGLFMTNLDDFLNLEEEKEVENPSKVPQKIKEGIKFENVWFKYPHAEDYVLKNASFELKPNSSIALIGANGAGKTTIVKLISKLYRPNKGKITLDGEDINNFKKDEYAKKLSVVFQDFSKYNLTVKENIAFGDIDKIKNIRSIKEAAKDSGIHEKIMSLPMKYNTTLLKWFEKGEDLSGGEWQKIAISRALFSDAEILILDEPTASLDPKAEYTVFRQFEKLSKKKMTIFISHRFANVKMADEILVIRNGKIIEQGPHKELMKKKGTYSKLYNLQAKRYRD